MWYKVTYFLKVVKNVQTDAMKTISLEFAIKI